MKKLTLMFAVFLLCVGSSLAQTVTVKSAIAQQMIDDGQITNDCVRELGGVANVAKGLDISAIKLTRKSLPAYKITGSGCAGGMYSGGNQGIWIYRFVSHKYELIFGEEGGVNVLPLKSYTNGYTNLELFQTSGGGAGSTIFKFNGSRYREQ